MKTQSHPARLYLAGLSLALAGAFAVGVQAAPGGPGMMGHGAMMAQGPMGGPGGHGGHGGRMFDGMMTRMLDRVNATPEQRTQIQQIMRKQAGEMGAQREAGRAMRQQVMTLFAGDDGCRAVEALRQQRLAVQTASKRMTRPAEISGVLTPEQRKQMADHMPARRDDAAPPARAPRHRRAEELKGPARDALHRP
jgi:Spy/CpxP family protein refolding chaperone